jgi:hypothetical protein
VKATLALLLLATSCLAAEKVYETGKFVNLDSETSSSTFGNYDSYTGHGYVMTGHRREEMLSVQLKDVVYTGECREHICKPGQWIVGDPIDVRIEKDEMYLRKPSGGEVKTRIIKRERVNPLVK